MFVNSSTRFLEVAWGALFCFVSPEGAAWRGPGAVFTFLLSGGLDHGVVKKENKTRCLLLMWLGPFCLLLPPHWGVSCIENIFSS